MSRGVAVVDLTGIALVVGIPASIATTVWGIYGGGRWVRHQIAKVQEMWRNQKQMQADIKALQEQVAALTKSTTETDNTVIDNIVRLETGVINLRATVNALDEQAQTLDERQRDGQEKLIIKFLDLLDKVEVLSKQVAELDKGWLRLGGKQKVE